MEIFKVNDVVGIKQTIEIKFHAIKMIYTD